MIKSFRWFIIPFLLSVAFSTYAQSIQRQSFGIYGTTGLNQSSIKGQIVGQPFSSVVFSDAQVSFAPGFLQAKANKGYYKPIEQPSISFRIYPTPSIHQFTIAGESSLENTQIKVLSLEGKTIYQLASAPSEEVNIQCSEWQEGLYIISIFNKKTKRQHFSKVLIQK